MFFSMLSLFFLNCSFWITCFKIIIAKNIIKSCNYSRDDFKRAKKRRRLLKGRVYAKTFREKNVKADKSNTSKNDYLFQDEPKSRLTES